MTFNGKPKSDGKPVPDMAQVLAYAIKYGTITMTEVRKGIAK